MLISFTGRQVLAALGVMAGLVLTGCNSDAPTAEVVAQTKQLTQGPIDRVASNSLIVHGRSYSHRDVRIEPAGTVLTPGMLVSLAQSGSQTTLSYTPQLSGPITGMRPAGLEVLGQLVLINELTSLQDGSLEQFDIGDEVQVSGYALGAGTVLASYLGAADSDSHRATGRIAALDESSAQFELGGLTVDYSRAQLSTAHGALSEGQSIVASGRYDQGMLHATSIDPATQPWTDGDLVDITAPLQITPLGQMLVADTPLAFHQASQLNGPLSGFAGLTRMARIQGTIASGVVLADQLDLHGALDSVAQGRIEELDASTGQLRLLGQFQATADAATRMVDHSMPGAAALSFADLRVGDTIRVVGNRQGENTQAVSLQRVAPAQSELAELQGRIQAMEPMLRSLTIDQVAVVLDAQAIQAASTHAIGALTGVELGEFVRVTGRYDPSAGQLLASEIRAFGLAKTRRHTLPILGELIDRVPDSFVFDTGPMEIFRLPPFGDLDFTIEILTDELPDDLPGTFDPDPFLQYISRFLNQPGQSHHNDIPPAEYSGINGNPEIGQNAWEFSVRLDNVRYGDFNLDNAYPSEHSGLNINPNFGYNLWQLGDNVGNLGLPQPQHNEYPAEHRGAIMPGYGSFDLLGGEQRSELGQNPALPQNIYRVHGRLEEIGNGIPPIPGFPVLDLDIFE